MAPKIEGHRHKELADFLKTRRAKISPEQVGLSTSSRRRTPGLRREEVAQLAGIGITWYTWLEQGRNIQVSAQVIESLSKVLLLDQQERSHLFLLANQPLPVDLTQHQEAVSPILQHVLDSIVYSPSFIIDLRWNVLAWNKAAILVFGDLEKMNARQRNIVWAMFTDDTYKKLYVDWNLHARSTLGRFRSTSGKYVEDPWLNQFIDELKAQSKEFDLWWSYHEIQDDHGVYKQLNHPRAGILDFESSSFDVPDHSNYKLFLHTPVPGTDTEMKMRSLFAE